MAFSQELAIATILMEASGEGDDGMLAVAYVILNRVKDGRWGENPASVVLAPEQFSCWNTKDPNRKRLAEMKNADPLLLAAENAFGRAYRGSVSDPTLGATHYYSTDIEAPDWAATGHFLVQIGKQRFYDKVP